MKIGFVISIFLGSLLFSIFANSQSCEILFAHKGKRFSYNLNSTYWASVETNVLNDEIIQRQSLRHFLDLNRNDRYWGGILIDIAISKLDNFSPIIIINSYGVQADTQHISRAGELARAFMFEVLSEMGVQHMVSLNWDRAILVPELTNNQWTEILNKLTEKLKKYEENNHPS